MNRRILLVGNPNCGKTTLFNALTGQNQKIGNWPGVTVEQKIGHFDYDSVTYEIIDLPGIYSLSMEDDSSLDEQVAFNAILNESFDIILQVVDTTQLERQLFLTSQLLELGKPLVMALNKMDLVHARHDEVNISLLTSKLGCSVISIEANNNIGLENLKRAFKMPIIGKPLQFNLQPRLVEKLDQLQSQITTQTSVPKYFLACRMLETSGENSADDLIFIDARYRKIHELHESIFRKSNYISDGITRRLDRWFLNRFLALPIFLIIMYSLFFFAIEVGGLFQDFFDISSEAFFVQAPGNLMRTLNFPEWFIALGMGAGRGLNTICAFIPVLAAMYFFLAFLELSGYLVRAAFIVDKFMQRLGLPGKSFIPMVIGFGCNVPGIMAARTLKTKSDRVVTVLMTPFMSCTARLAIFAVFVELFFKAHGAFIVFSLYLVGIAIAVFTAFFLRKYLFSDNVTPLVLEMPIYQLPSLKRLTRETYIRVKIFMRRAAKLVIPVCMILSLLSIHVTTGHSILEQIGHWIMPIFSPMGLNDNNWPAVVGLIMGTLAKEVVIGTLNTLYTHLPVLSSDQSFSLLGSLHEAVHSIGQNLSHLGYAIIHPLQAKISDQGLDASAKSGLFTSFNGGIGAYAYLLFVLLYMPCVSTMAAIAQETERRYMWFSIVWSTVIAYAAAVGFYQLATSIHHPLQSICWILSLALISSFIVKRMLNTILVKDNYVASNS